MAEFPALNFYTDAFLGDTIHLSAAEVGAYCRLLFVSWRITDGGISDDPKVLARFAGCSKAEWNRVGPAVMAFWNLGKDGKFRQKRLEVEREKARGRSENARNAGNASAAARALENNETHSTDVDVPLAFGSNGTPTHGQRNGNITTTTTTTTEGDREISVDSPPRDLRSLRPKGEDDGFNEFYGAYPRHVGRGAAARAYRGARKKTSAAILIAAAKAAAAKFADRDPEFIPHPATWLNGERWLDEAPARPPPKKPEWNF